MRSLQQRLELIDTTARNGKRPPSDRLRWVAEEALAALPQAVNLLAVAQACLHLLTTAENLDDERYAPLVRWLRTVVEGETGECTSADGVFEEWRQVA